MAENIDDRKARIITEDLAMLVARLSLALRKAKPGSDLPDRATDYLRRHKLQGSPLRMDNGGSVKISKSDANG